MNPDDEKTLQFVKQELEFAKLERPSFDNDCTSDIFWKLTGKIEAFMGIRQMIESKYLNGAQQPRAVRLGVGKFKSKEKQDSPLAPCSNNDEIEYDDLFGDV